MYDAKDDAVQVIVAEHAPITEFLCDDCRAHHAEVLGCLDDLGIVYEEDATLVRGLDYYTRTTFEVTARSGRKQSSLAGGGRYDNLVEQCGGPATPGIGFSLGVERTILHLADEVPDPQRSRQSVVDVYVACLGEERPAVRPGGHRPASGRLPGGDRHHRPRAQGTGPGRQPAAGAGAPGRRRIRA